MSIVKFCSNFSQVVAHPVYLPLLNLTQNRCIFYKKGPKRELKRKWAKDYSWLDPLLEYKEELKTKPVNEEPHMLHAVWRIQTCRGRPWWEKEIMEKFQLWSKNKKKLRESSGPVVIKNSPENNKRLGEVKHLVRILPLKFPHGIPENPEDFKHTQLKYNGEFILKKSLNSSELPLLPDAADSIKSKWDLESSTIVNELDSQKNRYSIHTEYYKTFYEYKRNEDNNEYRYNANKPGFDRQGTT